MPAQQNLSPCQSEQQGGRSWSQLRTLPAQQVVSLRRHKLPDGSAYVVHCQLDVPHRLVVHCQLNRPYHFDDKLQGGAAHCTLSAQCNALPRRHKQQEMAQDQYYSTSARQIASSSARAQEMAQDSVIHNSLTPCRHEQQEVAQEQCISMSARQIVSSSAQAQEMAQDSVIHNSSITVSPCRHKL